MTAHHEPLLVLAPPRSCSTVVTAMLGCHPDLFAVPEMKLFRRSSVGLMLDDWPAARNVSLTRRRAGLLRALAQVHDGDQSDRCIAEALSWLQERRDWTGAQLLDHVVSAASPRIVVEKSPENCARQEYLNRLLREAPRARLLHLVRHPVETARSLNTAWSAPRAWELDGSIRRQFDLATWLFNHSRISDALARVPSERWRRVRAEDLVNDPATHLPPLLEWLGVRSDASTVTAMCRTQEWAFASPGPPTANGGGDPHFFEEPTLRQVSLPSTVDVPRQWMTDPWTVISTLSLAASFGYA